MTSLDELKEGVVNSSHNNVAYDDLDLLIDLIKKLLRIDPK